MNDIEKLVSAVTFSNSGLAMLHREGAAAHLISPGVPRSPVGQHGQAGNSKKAPNFALAPVCPPCDSILRSDGDGGMVCKLWCMDMADDGGGMVNRREKDGTVNTDEKGTFRFCGKRCLGLYLGIGSDIEHVSYMIERDEKGEVRYEKDS